MDPQNNNDTIDVHRIIGLIYSTAVDPEQWPDLLNALAGFVDSLNLQPDALEQNLNDSSSRLSDDASDPNATSLSSVLLSLPQLDQPDTSSLVTHPDTISSILLTHFRNALNVSQRLVAYEEQNEMVSSLLDRLPVAILVVDANCRIVQSNNLARKILQTGELLHTEDNRIVTRLEDTTALLQETVKHLSHSAPTELHDRMLMLEESHENSDSLMAYLSPIKGVSDYSLDHLQPDHSHVAILISRPKSQPFVLPQSFVDLYKLTRKESEIASLLIRGYNVLEISENQFISDHTVRSHIKALLNKTGLKRQSDLIRFVLSGPGEGMSKEPGLISNTFSRMGEGDEEVQTLQLADGRLLTFHEYGDPNGKPLIFLHSVRGCHIEIDTLIGNAASELGIRVIAPNRPGYGLSDPKKMETVLDYVDDIQALADALGLQHFSVAGYVLGGLFAKAIAHRLPERVERLLLISCGVRAETEEDYAGMIPLYKMSNKLARELPQVIRMLSMIMVRGMLRNPQRFLEQFATQLEPEEAKLFESAHFSTSIIKGLQHAAVQGSSHIGREVVLLNQPWGFDPAEIKVPVTLWHGEKDRHMPFILAKKLVAQIPGCHLQPVQDAGHFMAFPRIRQILEAFYS